MDIISVMIKAPKSTVEDIVRRSPHIGKAAFGFVLCLASLARQSEHPKQLLSVSSDADSAKP